MSLQNNKEMLSFAKSFSFKVEGMCLQHLGEAILRVCEPEPRAASREPLFASLKRFPPKNPTPTKGTAPTKGNRTLILFPNSLHKRSRAVNRFVNNGKANFGSLIEWTGLFRSEETEMDLSFDFDQNFRDLWHNENTSSLHMTRCNIERELNKNFVEYKWVVSVRVLVQSKPTWFARNFDYFRRGTKCTDLHCAEQMGSVSQLLNCLK